MAEAVMFWNEPNNKSHWAFGIDPERRTFAAMVKLAARAVAAENPFCARMVRRYAPAPVGASAHGGHRAAF